MAKHHQRYVKITLAATLLSDNQFLNPIIQKIGFVLRFLGNSQIQAGAGTLTTSGVDCCVEKLPISTPYKSGTLSMDEQASAQCQR